MGNKPIVQIILIVTSIAVVLSYIKPAFSDISLKQDEIVRYESAVTKATDLNGALQALVATEKSISEREIRDLKRYLPATIDNALVMRDIQNIFKTVNIPITALESVSGNESQRTRRETESPLDGNESSKNVLDNAPEMVSRDFKLSFFGKYEQLKQVLQGLEVNAYPLEVVELVFSAPQSTLTAVEGGNSLPPGVSQYDLTLRVYALPGTD